MYLNALNFGLGEDIDALRDMVRRFAADEIAPRPMRTRRESRVTRGRSGCSRNSSAMSRSDGD